MNELVKTAVRTLACLEILATAEEGVSLVELSRMLGTPKSSLLMLLRTLVYLGYVERDGNELYAINPSLQGHELGWIGGPQAVLVRNAHPVMRELAASLRETCFIAVISPDDWLRLLSKVVSPREIRYDTELAHRHVPHRTASGRAQLAHWPRQRLEVYVAAWSRDDVPPAHRPDTAALDEQLARVREEGVALLIDEWVAGATGVSAPIFDSHGAPIGAVTVGSVTARFLADRNEIIDGVRQAGQRITANLPDRLRRNKASNINSANSNGLRAIMGGRHALS